MTAPLTVLARTAPTPAPAIATPKKIDWAMMRQNLDMVNRLAARDLAAVYGQVRTMDYAEGRAYLHDAMRILVDTYGGAATDLTVEWLDDMVLDIKAADAPDRVSREQLTKEVNWGTSPLRSGDDPLNRLHGILQKHIFGAQRNTVDLWAMQTGTKWARHARSDACAFCRVLASRGAVYGSEARAKYVGMGGVQKHYAGGRERGTRFKKGRVRGTRSAGQTYHDHCRCVIGPEVPNLDLNLPDYYDDFENQYDRAVEALRRKPDWNGLITMPQVTAEMRKLDYGN